MQERESSNFDRNIKMSSIRAGRDVFNVNNLNAETVVINTGGSSNEFRKDVFQATCFAPANAAEVLLDFEDAKSDEEPRSQEAKVLQEVLREDGCSEGTRIVAIHGKAGVGKSCILRALAQQEEVKRRFPGGVYYLSMGMDAEEDTLIRGLLEITRISGGEKLGKDLAGEKNLNVVLQRIGKWIGRKRCLLLVDDMWESNGLGAWAVAQLAHMFNNESKSVIVLTTRFISLATKGTAIEIRPLDPLSKEAEDTLLRYSKFDRKEVEPEKVREVFVKLLKMCGGLRVFLAVLGKGVAKLALKFKDERGFVWEEYWDMVHDSELLQTEIDGYTDLNKTLHTSLKLLSEDKGRLASSLSKSEFSLSQMHRALCVFQRQTAIPIGVCRRLWRVESEKSAWRIGNAFADVGLGDIRIEKKGSGYIKVVQLHDLIHLFATECAKAKGEVVKWHERLLESYIPKTTGEQWMRKWWNIAEDETEDEYLFGNVCRHLGSGGSVEELIALLLSAEWTELRLNHGEAQAWEKDFVECLKALNDVVSTKSEKEIGKGLCLVRDAVLESWGFIQQNRREMGFQVFGRLVDAKEMGVGKYLTSMSRTHVRPWLKPLQRCWPRPGEGNMLAEFVQNDDILDVALHGDSFIAVIAVGHEVVIIDIQARKIRKCTGHDGPVYKVAISSDGSKAWSRSQDFTVRQWDIETGKEMTRMLFGDNHWDKGEYGKDCLRCMDFAPDNSFLVTGSKNEVKLWNLATGARMGSTMHASESDLVECIAVSPDGRIIAAGTDGSALVLWDLHTFSLLRGELRGHTGGLNSVAFSPDGQAVVSCSPDCTIRVWDVETGTQNTTFSRDAGHAHVVTFSVNGQQIFSGHTDGIVVVWDMMSGTAIRSIRGHTGYVTDLAVTADGGYLITAGDDQTIRAWNLQAPPNPWGEHLGHCEAVCCLAFCPKGNFYASGAKDRKLRIWDAATGMPVGHPLCGHEEAVTCVAASQDGLRLVSGSSDHTVRIWNVAASASAGDPLRGHTRKVNCVAYSPDNQFVVSGSCDQTVRIWRAVDYPQIIGCVRNHGNKPVRTIKSKDRMRLTYKLVRSYSEGATSVAVSKDKQTVLVGTGDGYILSIDPFSGKQNCRQGGFSKIVRLEVSQNNELTSVDWKYGQERRWKVDNVHLTLISEEGSGNEVAQSEAQNLSVSHELKRVWCYNRFVYLGENGMKVATLPDRVTNNDYIWYYDPRLRSLAIGLENGQVLICQLEI